MRIATRLILVLGATFAVVMLLYAAVTLRQREKLLSDAFVRETETLARTLRIVTNNAVRDGRFADLDRVLREVLEDPQTFATAVFDSAGRMLAGSADADLGCIAPALPPQRQAGGESQGWADCGGRVRWVVAEATAPAAGVLLARRPTVLEADLRASRLRLLLLTLLLGFSASAGTLIVLHATLSVPLETLVRGIRAVGGPQPAEPISVPASARELAYVAAVVNEMAAEISEKQASLMREAEDRVALERRLHEAEQFALVGRLSGGLAHEIGSPLSVIRLRAETVAVDPDTPPRARKAAEVIVGEVDRISDLVRSLLHVARSHGVERHPVDLVQVVRGVVEHVRHYADPAGVALNLELPEQPVVVRGEETLLRHALLNVVRNAVQALSAHPGERLLSIRLRQTEKHVRIVVDDTGPGIAAQHLDRAFEPFYTTKEPGEGTGLGLAVSRGIVEEHGGELDLEPREGGGVRAIFLLPAPDQQDGGAA